MNSYDCFSNVTINYLNRFGEILDEMIQGMTSAEPTDSISHTFIVQMIPHHMGAIEMSRNLLKYTTCIPLQEIAQSIIASQTRSIRNMQQADSLCRNMCNSSRSVCSYLENYDRITETMFREMRNARPANNINVSFIREMIPHHSGAVRMSQNALSCHICPELTPILHAIITSQEKGIRQMECLLRRLNPEGC